MVSTSTRKWSSIWEHFSVVEDTKFAICSLCSKQVLHEGDNTKSYTSSNTVHHLKSRHSEEHKKYEELKATKEKQNSHKQTRQWWRSETKTGDTDKSKRVAITLGHK